MFRRQRFSKIISSFENIELQRAVVDPHWFNCGSGFGSIILGQCGSGSMDLMTKSFKILLLKRIQMFLIQNCIYFFLSLCEGLISQEKPPALKTEHLHVAL
jgi:hypothetical protein